MSSARSIEVPGLKGCGQGDWCPLGVGCGPTRGCNLQFHCVGEGVYALVNVEKLTREALAKAVCGESCCTVTAGNCDSCQLWKAKTSVADRLLQHFDREEG